MKSIRKFVGFGLVLAMLFVCLTGCLRIDMGVEIKEDGTASVTSKLMIEEDAYNMLASLGSSGEGGDVSEGDESADSGDASVPSGSDLDLESFQKETIDGKVYYTFEETVKVASYEELEQMLVSSGDEDGVDLFSEAHVKKDGNSYSFQATTVAMDNSASGMGSDDWLTLSMTITLPGKISDTTGEMINENTVRFVLDDFSEAKTLFVVSEVSALNTSEILVLAACGALLVVGVVVMILQKKKKG